MTMRNGSRIACMHHSANARDFESLRNFDHADQNHAAKQVIPSAGQLDSGCAPTELLTVRPA